MSFITIVELFETHPLEPLTYMVKLLSSRSVKTESLCQVTSPSIENSKGYRPAVELTVIVPFGTSQFVLSVTSNVNSGQRSSRISTSSEMIHPLASFTSTV